MVVLFLVTVFTLALVHLFPGGPVRALLGPRASAFQIAYYNHIYGFDQPSYVQYIKWVSQLLHGNLGFSYHLNQSFISHDLSVVRYLSNHIGVMYLGKLVEIGVADEVYLPPAHPYTRGLIDSAPSADPEAERAKGRQGITGELPSAIHPPSGCRFRTRCPFAQEICSTVEPELRPHGVSDHLAACHFPLQPALEVPAATAGQVS